jgi:hypothetical protein
MPFFRTRAPRGGKDGPAHLTLWLLLHEPFVAFDLLPAVERLPTDAFQARIAGRFVTPGVLHDGGAWPVAAAQAHLAAHGSDHGALDPPEGAIPRVCAMAGQLAPSA